ncbi:MAG TPA: CHASE3 domain-containing protein [Candidatus Acidoferrum sp.]|jgi:signal transduction histidine kinase|nr:CHASE3 domain-containing protein [Candidatus Acidoferrum sp.]
MLPASLQGMSSRQKARLAFLSALVLLFGCGIAASITIARFIRAAKWAAHSYEVQVALGDLQTSLSNAARTRTVYLNSGDETTLSEYPVTKRHVHNDLTQFRELIRDNPLQVSQAKELDDIVLRRLELLDAAIEMRRAGPLDDVTQLRLSRENVTAASDFVEVSQRMMDEEEKLLGQRRELFGSLFFWVLFILAAGFVIAVVLLWIHFRLLSTELVERERMEESARHLSVRVLQLQDEERRKFSRELHDSLGQLLAVAKMHMTVLLDKNPQDELLKEIDQLLTDSVSETRTISHLLHPPLLDEVGIASAARWYAEGFAKRSGIEIVADIPDDLKRMSRPAELVLFRVLQESLTNIHRHSRSSRAEISLQTNTKGAILRIRDYGKGIPRDMLENFKQTGGNVGVGLAGMRERVREQGGQFDIQSDRNGTTITVIMPTAPAESNANLTAPLPAD